jgi:hypothetical protein
VTAARQDSTVSWSPMFSSTHSSVTLGSTTSCTCWTSTVNSASSLVPLGTAAEVQLVAGRGAEQLAVESGGHPALTHLVQTSPRCSGRRPGSPSRSADRVSVTWSPDCTGRSTSASDPWRLTSASIACSTSSWDGSNAGQLDAQAAVAVQRDLRAHLAGGVELDRPVLGPGGDLDLRVGDQVDLVASRTRRF